MSISDFFKTDKLWNDTKKKLSKIDTDRLLTRSEYLKLVGKDSFTDDAYKEYYKQYLERRK